MKTFRSNHDGHDERDGKEHYPDDFHRISQGPAMDEIDALLNRYPDLEGCAEEIRRAAQILTGAYWEGKKVLTCGNGGSAADAEHIAGELMKGFMLKRPLAEGMKEKISRAYPKDGAFLAEKLQGALPAIALVSPTALISAIANDTSAEMVFAQQVYGYGQAGDVLMALSTSGNSSNVIRAVQTASVLGLHTIGLTGPSGGEMMGLCQVCIRVPGRTPAEIQERHLPVYHGLCAQVEKEFFLRLTIDY